MYYVSLIQEVAVDRLHSQQSRLLDLQCINCRLHFRTKSKNKKNYNFAIFPFLLLY